MRVIISRRGVLGKGETEKNSHMGKQKLTTKDTKNENGVR